ncbi:MAG: alpha/beta hydrolase, partial [Planctomycetota bacterium]
HGERVASAVLIGVEGPDETQKLPFAYSTPVKKISAMVAADPVVGKDVPDFEALLRRVLEKLAREPLEVEVTQPVSGETVTVPVGPSGLRWILIRDIGDASDLPVFPRLLHSIERGDPSLLTWFVQKRYGMSSYPTHAFTMDPASGCSTERAARILREAQTCILGNAMNFGSPAIDAVWQMPVLGDDFRAPLVTNVRTLFLSGTLDANTPPYQAERMRWGFVDSVHIVQRNGGHESWLVNPKVPPLLHDFFAGQDVSGRDVDLPPLRFIPVEGDPGDLRHPSLGN